MTASPDNPYSVERLHDSLLKLLALPDDSNMPHRLSAFPNAALKRLDPGAVYTEPGTQRWSSDKVSEARIVEALWILVSHGLVYLAFPFRYEPAGPWLELAHCSWQLTGYGRTAAAGEDVNPADAEGYLRRLREAAPGAGEALFAYAREALTSFRHECYLASAVMIGVASEAAVFDVAEDFAVWLPAADGTKLRGALTSRMVFSRKFDEFRKRLEAHKPELPSELQDDLDVTLISVASLLRVDRNDSGHPTGKKISRERQHGNLTIFVPYAQRLYALRAFFKTRPRTCP